MDYNHTLTYRTFDQLLEDVTIDLYSFALENMIEPQQLIKVVRKINYDLGLRINQQREAILEVCHGHVKLPDNFYTFNYALVCGDYVKYSSYPTGGTNIQEVPYTEVPPATDACDATTVGPYGDTSIKPRVFVNCKGESYELIQVINPTYTQVYRTLTPLKMKPSQEIDCDCPNLYYDHQNEGWIKHGHLYTSFQDGKVYINYQSHMEDDEGNLLVPDHPLLNDYYEYALKKRILENLFMNGEDVGQKIQLVNGELRAARNNALSLVNTPNFSEMKRLWEANRKAQYGRFYDMFSSYSPNNNRGYNSRRVM